MEVNRRDGSGEHGAVVLGPPHHAALLGPYAHAHACIVAPDTRARVAVRRGHLRAGGEVAVGVRGVGAVHGAAQAASEAAGRGLEARGRRLVEVGVVHPAGGRESALQVPAGRCSFEYAADNTKENSTRSNLR